MLLLQVVAAGDGFVSVVLVFVLLFGWDVRKKGGLAEWLHSMLALAGEVRAYRREGQIWRRRRRQRRRRRRRRITESS